MMVRFASIQVLSLSVEKDFYSYYDKKKDLRAIGSQMIGLAQWTGNDARDAEVDTP